MVIRSRTRWLVIVAVAVIVGGYALRHHGFGPVAYVLVAIGVTGIVVSFRMRVAASDSGVTVVNLGRPTRIPWAEIDGFGMRRIGYASNSVEIRLRDGRRFRGWALTSAGAAGYPQAYVDSALDDLRRRLAQAKGESVEEAGERAVSDALRAAEAGDYVPFWNLAQDFHVVPEQLWGPLEDLAEQGKVDKEALEASGPPISDRTRRYLARKYPEALDEMDRR